MTTAHHVRVQHIPFREPANPFQRLFWLLPAALVLGHWGGGLRPSVMAAVVIGVLWQLTFRRDLADRLSTLAAFYLVGAVLIVILPAATLEDPEGFLLARSVFLVMALVMTEQLLRLRDYRLASRERRERETVPTRP